VVSDIQRPKGEHKNDREAKFCASCGIPLPEPGPPIAPPPSTLPEQVRPPFAHEQPTPSPSERATQDVVEPASPPRTVKWECMKCGHVWDGVPPAQRKLRATCRSCHSRYVYPGWQDKKWTQVSAIVKNMRGQRCQECGATNVQLHTHHVLPLRKRGDSRWENLEVLCEDCHFKRHHWLLWLLRGLLSPMHWKRQI